MGDIKVRPNIRVRTPKGWKTYKSKTKANHIKMEGQVVEVGGYFDLGNGVKAKSPGESGTPENDCNCRCFLDYEMMTVEEFQERGGRWKNESKVHQKTEINKMSGDNGTWAETEPIVHSKEELKEITEYAQSKNINLYNTKLFDGDTELLKEQIDTLSSTLKEFKIGDKITITFANLDDDDFAQTVNNTITFNNKVLRNRDITNKVLNADNYLASTDISGIAIHEAGHIISRKYGEKGIEIAKKAYYNVHKEEIEDIKVVDYLTDAISVYSTSKDEVGSRGRFNKKQYKEVLPEVLAKDFTNPNDFTDEYIKILKDVIM